MAEWGGDVGGEDGRLIGWMKAAAEHADRRAGEVRAKRSDWALAAIEISISAHGISTDGIWFDVHGDQGIGTEVYLLKWDEITEDAEAEGGNPLLYAIDEVVKEMIDA